jgi:hypothetical protein
MTCHVNGGAPGAPQFTYGGTLYDGKGNPIVGAEVRVAYASGTGASAYTSSLGTFFIEGPPLQGPAHVGVRDATQTKDMVESITANGITNGGGCTSCHCVGSNCDQPPVDLP